jgi:hypothetical protein
LLISGALNYVTTHQLARINALPRAEDMRQAIRIGILEILPFFERSRDEAIVWLTLAAAAASRPSLRSAQARMVELLRGIVMDALRRGPDPGRSEAGIRTAAIVSPLPSMG